MRLLLGSFNTLKFWQVAVLAGVLIGGAGIAYGGYALVSGSESSGLGENQQFIPVQSGDLVNQVSTNGSLIFPNRVTVTFGSQGTVQDVLVEEGQQVEEEQLLSRLDEVTVTSLEKALAQARVNLQNAEDALLDVRQLYSPLELAQAEENVTNFVLQVQNATDALAEDMVP